jgi:hypothetical protein
MGRFLALSVVVAVVLAVACSSNGNGGGGAVAALTCPGGFDAGDTLTGNGTFADSSHGQCGHLLTGTAANGAPCTNNTDCMPTCCACNDGSGRSAEVVFCHNGTCIVGPDVCCVWIDRNEGPDGGGSPYECTH